LSRFVSGGGPSALSSALRAAAPSLLALNRD
jgi:hypothetical protein